MGEENLHLWKEPEEGAATTLYLGRTWENHTQHKMSTWFLFFTCMGSWAGTSISVTEPGGPCARDFLCLNNNILRIDCHWSAPNWAQYTDPWLLFTSNHEPDIQSRCIFRDNTCTVHLPEENVLVSSDNFTITLHHRVSGKELVTCQISDYLPRKYVKLDPPFDLHSNVSSDHCVLSWATSPELEPLGSLFSYELSFKRQEEAWEQARHKDRIVGVSRIILEAIELKPGSTYEAKLRVQMTTQEDEMLENRYEGQWSEWSQPVWFPSPQRQGHRNSPLGQPHNALVTVCILVLLTSLTYLLFKLAPRVKRTFYKNVPSPAAFFQPLYKVHNGNFQCLHLGEGLRTWTGSHKVNLRSNEAFASTSSGVSDPAILESIDLLMCDPAEPWKLGLKKESLGVQDTPVGHVEAGPPLAYLPQEDWGLARPPSPASRGPAGSTDYCALSCSDGGFTSGSTGTRQSFVPILARAQGLSCAQSTGDAQQEYACVGAGQHLT
ncbi:interleukin-9 receptor [Suncus etruscus]|uniref:interleukin-9 receptor n=1 Tax=Suncus etruscus TaxID=109475 RepID=UPI002110D237|nr:interleukin-9 receptor [Suncus etruscus]